MPRYFFNTRIGDELISDPEGEELRNPDRAWEIARAMIRELLKTEDAERGLLNAVLEVTDDEGEIVLEFPFAEAHPRCLRSTGNKTLTTSDVRRFDIAAQHRTLASIPVASSALRKRCFRLRSGGKILKTVAQEGHRRAVLARARIRLPQKGEHMMIYSSHRAACCSPVPLSVRLRSALPRSSRPVRPRRRHRPPRRRFRRVHP